MNSIGARCQRSDRRKVSWAVLAEIIVSAAFAVSLVLFAMFPFLVGPHRTNQVSWIKSTEFSSPNGTYVFDVLRQGDDDSADWPTNRRFVRIVCRTTNTVSCEGWIPVDVNGGGLRIRIEWTSEEQALVMTYASAFDTDERWEELRVR